jgi:hypothetical protein
MKGLTLGVLTGLLLSGCTNQQLYSSMEGARENECRQIADPNERDLCFDNARKSYDKYEQQRKESQAR